MHSTGSGGSPGTGRGERVGERSSSKIDVDGTPSARASKEQGPSRPIHLGGTPTGSALQASSGENAEASMADAAGTVALSDAAPPLLPGDTRQKDSGGRNPERGQQEKVQQEKEQQEKRQQERVQQEKGQHRAGTPGAGTLPLRPGSTASPESPALTSVDQAPEAVGEPAVALVGVDQHSGGTSPAGELAMSTSAPVLPPRVRLGGGVKPREMSQSEDATWPSVGLKQGTQSRARRESVGALPESTGGEALVHQQGIALGRTEVLGLPPKEEIVEKLRLQPHPEGGFFAETFRDSTVSLTLEQLPNNRGFKVGRPISTAIFFLMPSGCVSRLHRIPSQEVWHFYLGDPLTILQLDDETGTVTKTVLGTDILSGQTPQHVVPAGIWFGAYPTNDFDENGTFVGGYGSDGVELGRYSLVGCTVAPAFEFADFELARRTDLLSRHPHAAAYILALTDP